MHLKLFKPDFKNDKKGSDPDFWYFNRYMKNNKLKQALNGDVYKKNRSIKETINQTTIFKNEYNVLPQKKSNEDNSKSSNDTSMKNRKTTNSNSISITKGSFMITHLLNNFNSSVSNYTNKIKQPLTKSSYPNIIQIESCYQDGQNSFTKRRNDLNDTYDNPSLLPNVFQSNSPQNVINPLSNPKKMKHKGVMFNHSNALFEKIKKKYKFYLQEDNFFEKDKWKMFDHSNPSTKIILKNSVHCLQIILKKEKNQ